MGTRNISWINEVKNNTKDTYVIWCWDEDNLGEFRDWDSRELVGRNDDGQWVEIGPDEHFMVTGCGIPDGGTYKDKPKCRIVAKKDMIKAKRNHDPDVGLRLNRVMGPDKPHETDRLVYRDHKEVTEIAAIDFPRGTEQNLSLVISDDGIRLEVREQKESDEWRAYLFGKKLGDFAKASLADIAQLALEAAKAALFAA